MIQVKLKNSDKMKCIFFLFKDMVDANFELSSMFNSMNTSMLIAKECLKNETEEDTTYQGLETFAATIDSSKTIIVLNRNLCINCLLIVVREKLLFRKLNNRKTGGSMITQN